MKKVKGGLGSGRGGQGITMVDCICTGFYPFKNVTNILSKGKLSSNNGNNPSNSFMIMAIQ